MSASATSATAGIAGQGETALGLLPELLFYGSKRILKLSFPQLRVNVLYVLDNRKIIAALSVLRGLQSLYQQRFKRGDK